MSARNIVMMVDTMTMIALLSRAWAKSKRSNVVW